MDTKVIDDILAIDNGIRYVGILAGKDQFTQVASKARRDVELLLEKEEARARKNNLALPDCFCFARMSVN